MSKAKRINRKDFLNFLSRISGLKGISQNEYTGKNIFHLGQEDDTFQVEFIPESKDHLYTIRIMGISREAEPYHSQCVEYLEDLNLVGRVILVDTEYTTSIVKVDINKVLTELGL